MPQGAPNPLPTSVCTPEKCAVCPTLLPVPNIMRRNTVHRMAVLRTLEWTQRTPATNSDRDTATDAALARIVRCSGEGSEASFDLSQKDDIFTAVYSLGNWARLPVWACVDQRQQALLGCLQTAQSIHFTNCAGLLGTTLWAYHDPNRRATLISYNSGDLVLGTASHNVTCTVRAKCCHGCGFPTQWRPLAVFTLITFATAVDARIASPMRRAAQSVPKARTGCFHHASLSASDRVLPLAWNAAHRRSVNRPECR